MLQSAEWVWGVWWPSPNGVGGPPHTHDLGGPAQGGSWEGGTPVDHLWDHQPHTTHITTSPAHI